MRRGAARLYRVDGAFWQNRPFVYPTVYPCRFFTPEKLRNACGAGTPARGVRLTPESGHQSFFKVGWHVGLSEPRVPLARPREDGGKCVPCLSCPPPSQSRSSGCEHPYVAAWARRSQSRAVKKSKAADPRHPGTASDSNASYLVAR